MTRIIQIFRDTLLTIPRALALAPLVFLLMVAGEGLQHIVEYRLGMFDSKDAFMALAKSPLRLGFGILKAVTLLLGATLIARSLWIANATPASPSFRAVGWPYLKWPGAGGLTVVPVLILFAPFYWLHARFHYLSFDSDLAPLWLTLDSLLIGLLGIVIGVANWLGMRMLWETRPDRITAR